MPKWTTMEELAELCGVTISAISKDLKKARITGTRWEGRVFFNKHQVKYAEELYARSPRRGRGQKREVKPDDNEFL